ncbi:hypothetical protein D3C80_1501050 [compost metagenome]
MRRQPGDAATILHQAFQCLGAADGHACAQLDAAFAVGLLDAGAGGGALLAQVVVLAGQVAGAKSVAPGQRMGGAGHRQQAVAVQQVAGESLVVEGAFDEAQADAAILQLCFHFACIADGEVHRHGRMHLVETFDQFRQQVAAQGGAGAKAKLTVIEAGETAQVALGGGFQGEDALGVLQ